MKTNIEEFLKKVKEKSKKMKAIPLDDEKIKLIKKVVEKCLKIEKTEKINYLEVGSGIGYSFFRLSLIFNFYNSILIERDKNKFEKLKENIKIFEKLTNKKVKAKLINKDASEFLKEYLKDYKKKFNIVLVDANKSKYPEYLELLKNKSGIIIFDNTFFNNLKENKKNKTIIKKLKVFHKKLLEENNYHIFHFKIKDGITILIRNNEF